jgi:hypothetical protein
MAHESPYQALTYPLSYSGQRRCLRSSARNPGDEVSRIKAIKQAIEREFAAMTGRSLAIFLDEDDIRTGEE